MKQIINKNFARQFLGLAIVGLMIIFAVGCSRTDTSINVNVATNGNSANSNPATVSNPVSTTTNSASPTSATSPIEQKANAVVGKWETTTALDDKIAFDFSQPKKEGETYVGTYTFYVNDTKDAPAKYIVSKDKMIKFFDAEGGVYPLIKVSISDDGQTLIYNDQKGGKTRLTKAGSLANKPTDSTRKEKSDCTVIADNTDYFVSATEKTIKLKKGTSVNVRSWEMHQGLYAVNAKIDGKWVKGEINYELIDCPDDGKDGKENN